MPPLVYFQFVCADWQIYLRRPVYFVYANKIIYLSRQMNLSAQTSAFVCADKMCILKPCIFMQKICKKQVWENKSDYLQNCMKSSA